MSDGGKGSSARPFSVSYKDYTDRWDMIFGGAKEDKKRAGDALDELEKISQELGLYDNDVNPMIKLHSGS